MVPLSNASTTRNPRARLAIDEKGERDRRKERMDPRNLLLKEIHPLEDIKNSFSFNNIKSFFNIYLSYHPKRDISLSLNRMSNFLGS